MGNIPWGLHLAAELGLESEINTLRPRQNGCHVADNVYKCISSNKNFRILNKILLKYVPWGLIDNMVALAQITAWHRTGDKPLSEAMIFASLGLNKLAH